MTTAKQVRLLPEERPQLTFNMVALHTLPSDEELEGLEPSKALIQHIRDVGVTTPVLLCMTTGNKRKPGTLKVVEGRRRIKAARRIGLDVIPAVWVSESELGTLSAAALTVASNALRSDNLASDIKALAAMEKAGASEEDIAKATGLTKTQVRAKLSLTVSLDSRLQQALQEGRISQNLAMDAAKLSGRQQGELVKLMAERPLTRQDVKEQRNVNVQGAQAAMSEVLAGHVALSDRVAGAIDFPDPSGAGGRAIRLLDQLLDGLGAKATPEVLSAGDLLRAALSELE